MPTGLNGIKRAKASSISTQLESHFHQQKAQLVCEQGYLRKMWLDVSYKDTQH